MELGDLQRLSVKKPLESANPKKRKVMKSKGGDGVFDELYVSNNSFGMGQSSCFLFLC